MNTDPNNIDPDATELGDRGQAENADHDDSVVDPWRTQSTSQEPPVRGELPWTGSELQSIGPYRIIGLIAEGGMGAVYRAEQEVPIRRQVALKLIKGGKDSSRVVARFEAERQALAMMEHPHIARIFDAGTTEEGVPYFVMELVDGETLTDHCERHELSVAERLELFVSVCNAVSHAHARGIVHRDLKPSNVLVSVHDGKSVPKVIDFGLAKATDHQTKLTDKTMNTQMGQIVGTLQYMSPEQAESGALDVDARTDIYALGVILYELLTGTPPLESESIRGANLIEVLEMIRETEPPRPSHRLAQSPVTASSDTKSRRHAPSQLKRLLRGELDWVVMRAIEKDRERRYPSAEAFADDINRFLNDQPVLARPPSQIYQTKKFLKRNRFKAITAAAIFLAVAAAIALTPMIVNLQREAKIAKLEQTLESSLAAVDLSSSQWEESRLRIGALRTDDATRADTMVKRWNDAVLKRIERELQIPRLTKEAKANIGDAIGRLSSENLKAEQRQMLDDARIKLDQMNLDWSFVAAADTEQPDTFAAFFDTADVDQSTGVTKLRQPFSVKWDRRTMKPSDDFAPLTPLRQACQGDSRVSATFDEWETSHSVGISLNVVDGVGYDCILATDFSLEANLTPDTLVLPSLGEARRHSARFRMEVRRGTTTLTRRYVSSDLIPAGPLKMEAKREGNVFSIRINELAPQSILDPFPLCSGDKGLIGVRGCPGVTLRSLRFDRRSEALGETPMKVGDEAFQDKDFASATDAYQRQLSIVAPDSDVASECRYKLAMCLREQGKAAESQSMLSELLQSEGKVWPALAGITLWQTALANGNDGEADAYYATLRASGRLRDAAYLATAATRQAILQSALSGMSLSNLLKADPNRLERMRRAAEIDRLLSQTGYGSVLTQIELARALRLENRDDDAIKHLSELFERSRQQEVFRRLNRVTRLSRDPRVALAQVDEQMANKANPPSFFYVLRAQANAAIGDWDAVERDIETGLNTAATDGFAHTSLCLMSGFLHHRRGQRARALDSWTKGYTHMRQQAAGDSQAVMESRLVYLLILGGLSGKLSREDAMAVTRVATRQLGGGALTAVYQPESIFRCARTMWHSKRGMELAEALAFENIDLVERITLPPTLAAYQFVVLGAFDGNATPADRDVIWAVTGQIIDQYVVGGELALPQFMQLGLTWKGTTNFLGWAGVRDELENQLRSRVAYVMGHRMIARGDRDAAEDFFREAAELRDADQNVKTLAAECLALLEADEGKLELGWSSPVPTQVNLVDEQGESRLLRVDGQTSVRLPPGDYTLQCDDADFDTDLEFDRVSIKAGRTSAATLKSRWNPDEHESILPGLLTHPAKERFDRDWQLIRTYNEHHVTDFAWSPDGKEIACVGNDHVIRLYEYGSGEPLRAFVHEASRLRTIDWSPDGTTLAVGNQAGRLSFVDPNTGKSTSVPLKEQAAAIARVRWNHAGTRLAVVGRDSAVMIVDRQGVLRSSLKHHRTDIRDVSWSPDGQTLATAATDGVILWSVRNEEPTRVLKDLPDATFVAFSPDATRLAVATRTLLGIVDLNSGQITNTADVPDGKHVRSVAWHPSEDSILAVGWYFGWLRWNFSNSTDDEIVTLPQSGNGPIRQHPTDPAYAIASRNGYRTTSLEWEDHSNCFPDHWLLVSSFDVSPSSSHLGIVQSNGAFAIQKLSDGSVHQHKGPDKIQRLMWHPEHEVVLGASRGGELIVFDGQCNVLFRASSTCGEIQQWDWSADGRQLFALNTKGELYRFPAAIDEGTSAESGLAFGFEPATRVAEEVGQMDRFAIHPDGQILACRAMNGPIDLRSLSNGRRLHQIVYANSNQWLQFSRDGSRLAASHGSDVGIWSSGPIWQGTAYTDKADLGDPFIDGCIVDQKHALLITAVGELFAYDFEANSIRAIRGYGESLLSIRQTSDGQVWIGSQRGVFREIDPDDGSVRSLSVVLSDGNMVRMSRSGMVIGPDSSLEGLSCLYLEDGVQRLISANALYSDEE